MQGMITRLIFDAPEAADAELAELEAQAATIAEVGGFRALYGLRTGRTEVVIVRIFETSTGMGQSLAGPLRPDLADRFSAPPLRMMGEVAVARTA